MSQFLRVVCVLCLGVCLLGVLAPGVFAPLRQPLGVHGPAGGDGDEREARLETRADAGRAHERPAADSPMIEALDSVIGQQDVVFGPLGDQLQTDLARADGVLSETKRRNRDAIQQAGRRVRLPGRSPHILLILVPGLTTDTIHCYSEAAAPTPGFDALASRGVRLSRFEPAANGDYADWTCLVEGSTSPNAGRSQSFITALWQAGYDTAFVGDASRFIGDPRGLRFDHWYGFKTAVDAANRFPTSVWSDEKRLELKPSVKPAAGLNRTMPASHQLLLQEAVERLGNPAQSRPVLALVTLRTEGWSPTERDSIPSLLTSMLEQARLSSSTVIMIAGIPGADAAGASSRSWPFFATSSQHIDHGTVGTEPTNWSDVAATVSEIAEVSTRPTKLRGVSRLSAWHGTTSGRKQRD